MLRAVLAKLFARIGGGRGLFQPQGRMDHRAPERVVVLTPGEIPTTDLYIRGQVERQFGKEVRYIDTLGNSPEQITLGENCLIIIVRHAPRLWLRWLTHQGERLSGVAFLMDDDIPAAVKAFELPLDYAVKTAWRYACTRRLLARLCSEVWVSTPELARRYAASSPRLWEPEYFGALSMGAPDAVVYFYHGSWAHRREIEWLVPIVKRVQEAVPHAWFEIMGTDRVRHLLHGIPRVRVVHPMPWKDYHAYAGTVRYQLGLAPCLDTDFNRARSHSKVFDITRLGAAGIYSHVIPYSERVIHGQTGFLCVNDRDKWITAITSLLKDRDMRHSLYQRASEWCYSSKLHD